MAIHLLRLLRREDAALGISANRLSALSVVGFGGRRTLGALASAEQVTPPSMTRIVAALERDGLIERGADPADGRVSWIEATVKGRGVLEEGRARRTHRLTEHLRTLDADDLAALARAAELLEAALRELA
ncbi:MAG: MarR family winged helix-turn-helix transcriptional regulator [Dehalococcoidia bacterium]